MLAILSKLIPIRDWIYLGVFVALIGAFAYYTHHERVVGEQKIVAADAIAVKKQAAAVAKVESNASVAISSALSAYNAQRAAPLAAVPHLVCRAARSGGNVPGHAGTSGSGHDQTAVPAESTVPFDPAPAVVSDARDADAQITLLQAYIQSCQKAGICKATK